jgi:hypothetical protein
MLIDWSKTAYKGYKIKFKLFIFDTIPYTFSNCSSWSCTRAWLDYNNRTLEIKEGRKEIIKLKLSLDGSSHQTGDAAFTPATPHDSYHSRANTDSQNSHNTQQTGVKQNKFCFMQKDTQPSQTRSGGHIKPNPTQNRCGWCLFAYGEYKLDQT